MPTKKTETAKKTEMSYEQGIERFEEIVDRLGAGNVPLTESIRLFKEGKELSSALKRMLDDFNGEITKLNQSGTEFEKAEISVTEDEPV